MRAVFDRRFGFERRQDLASVRERLAAIRFIQHRRRVNVQNWGLSGRVRLGALAIYVLSGYDEATSPEYARQSQNKRVG